MVFSTDRDDAPNQKDDFTRMIIITPDNQITTVKCGTWNHKKHGFRFKYALLRFQRDQGASNLVVTVLNQKEFADGDLLIIPESSIVKFINQTEQ